MPLARTAHFSSDSRWNNMKSQTKFLNYSLYLDLSGPRRAEKSFDFGDNQGSLIAIGRALRRMDVGFLALRLRLFFRL